MMISIIPGNLHAQGNESNAGAFGAILSGKAGKNSVFHQLIMRMAQNDLLAAEMIKEQGTELPFISEELMEQNPEWLSMIGASSLSSLELDEAVRLVTSLVQTDRSEMGLDLPHLQRSDENMAAGDEAAAAEGESSDRTGQENLPSGSELDRTAAAAALKVISQFLFEQWTQFSAEKVSQDFQQGGNQPALSGQQSFVHADEQQQRMLQALDSWSRTGDSSSMERLLTALKENRIFYDRVAREFAEWMQQRPVYITQASSAADSSIVSISSNADAMAIKQPLVSFAHENHSEETAVMQGARATIHHEAPANAFFASHLQLESPLRVFVGSQIAASSASDEVNINNFAKEMSQFIVKQFDVVRLQGMSEATIRLVPEHLGQVNITISMQNGHLTAMITSDNAYAKEMLELQLPMLRQALQTQGLQVERLEVAYQSNAHAQHGHGQPFGSSDQQGASYYSPPNDDASEKYEYFDDYYEEEHFVHEQESGNPVMRQPGSSFEASA